MITKTNYVALFLATLLLFTCTLSAQNNYGGNNQSHNIGTINNTINNITNITNNNKSISSTELKKIETNISRVSKELQADIDNAFVQLKSINLDNFAETEKNLQKFNQNIRINYAKLEKGQEAIQLEQLKTTQKMASLETDFKTVINNLDIGIKQIAYLKDNMEIVVANLNKINNKLDEKFKQIENLIKTNFELFEEQLKKESKRTRKEIQKNKTAIEALTNNFEDFKSQLNDNLNSLESSLLSEIRQMSHKILNRLDSLKREILEGFKENKKGHDKILNSLSFLSYLEFIQVLQSKESHQQLAELIALAKTDKINNDLFLKKLDKFTKSLDNIDRQTFLNSKFVPNQTKFNTNIYTVKSKLEGENSYRYSYFIQLQKNSSGYYHYDPIKQARSYEQITCESDKAICIAKHGGRYALLKILGSSDDDLEVTSLLNLKQGIKYIKRQLFDKINYYHFQNKYGKWGIFNENGTLLIADKVKHNNQFKLITKENKVTAVLKDNEGNKILEYPLK